MDETAIGALPTAFLERLKLITPTVTFPAVLDSFSKPKPISFRVNTLKTDPQTVLQELTTLGLPIERVAWYESAFLLHAEKAVLMQTKLYKEGHIYIQNLSSMIPALVLHPRTRDEVCDLAAAPGSKTTQIAMIMRNKGHILANDISRSRLFRLKDNLKQQGITNTELCAVPGQAIWKNYPEHFDKVLVDVPCTMEGRFSTLDPESYKDWTPKKVKLLSQLQKYLLRSAVTATKPGGLIVYSTCTLEPEENEEVVDWILEKECGLVQVEEIELNLPETQPGLLHWKKKHFNPQLAKTLRILPSPTMEGFFIAALRKR